MEIAVSSIQQITIMFTYGSMPSDLIKINVALSGSTNNMSLLIKVLLSRSYKFWLIGTWIDRANNKMMHSSL